jgi:probable F420-dependent oxidoreductase
MIDADGIKRYQHPLAAMSHFLGELDRFGAPRARVLAALAPKMVKLAGMRALGTHPYLVPVAHTRELRETMPPGKLIAPAVGVVLERDTDLARERARNDLATYLALPNYVTTWLRLGFDESDIAGRGSDRLVDALYAFGTDDKIRARVDEHRAAGADHVCVRVVTGSPMTGRDEPLPRTEWRSLATILT